MFKKVAAFTAIIAVFGVGFALIGQNGAQARVCFVNDADCGSLVDVNGQDYSGNCAEYECNTDDGDTECPATRTGARKDWIDGHSGDSGESSYWKQVKCPYSSKRFMDCPKAWRLTCPSVEYQSTLTCGDYHDCTCPAKYRYTHELFGGDNENHVKTLAGDEDVLHCMATGSYCAEIRADGTEDVDNIKFSACQCTNYPFSSSTTPHATPYVGTSGKDFCRDSDGNEYYRGFNCPIEYYPYTESQCDFGPDVSGNKCFDYSSQTWRYERCKDCSRFPATDLTYVKTGLTMTGSGAPTAYGCVDNGEACMLNNFASAGSSFTLQSDTIKIGDVEFGPYEHAYNGNYNSENNIQRLWGEDWPKYTYVTCPYENEGQQRHFIVKCTEPGMRPTVDGELKYDANGSPVMINGEQATYKAGEACVPVSCEEAVKEVLQKAPAPFGDKYGILLKNPVYADGNKVKVYNNGNVSESYYFVDAYGNPIVEQYVNTKNGGFLRTVIDSQSNHPVTVRNFSSGTQPGTNKAKFYGRIYESNEQWAADGGRGPGTLPKIIAERDIDRLYTAVLTTGGTNNQAWGPHNQGLMKGHRTAIVIENLNLGEYPGYEKQYIRKCRRQACVATVNGEKQLWRTSGYSTYSDNYSNYYHMCDRVDPLSGNHCTAGICDRSSTGGQWLHKRWICKKMSNSTMPYWDKVSQGDMLLGNNSSNEETRCGDVKDGKCITCFAKGYVNKNVYQSDYLNSNQTQYLGCNDWTETSNLTVTGYNYCNYKPFGHSSATLHGGTCNTEVQLICRRYANPNKKPDVLKVGPSKENNCLGEESEGPLQPGITSADNAHLDRSPSGTLWGEDVPSNCEDASIVITLQNYDAEDCYDNGNSTGSTTSKDFLTSPLGLVKTPADRYISVQEFYDDLDRDNGWSSIDESEHYNLSQTKDVFKRMLERSCKIGSTEYVKPKITFSGEHFPADYGSFLTHRNSEFDAGVVSYGEDGDATPDTFETYKMVIRGIDIEFTEDDVEITRPIALIDVELSGKNVTLAYRMNPRRNEAFIPDTYRVVGADLPAEIHGELGSPSMTILNSVINLTKLETNDGYYNSTYQLPTPAEDGHDDYDYGEEVIGLGTSYSFASPLKIKDSEINVCEIELWNPATFISSNGNNLVQKKEGCSSATMKIRAMFDSDRYKYVLNGLDVDVGNAYGDTTGNCQRAYFVGSGNNDNDITVSGTMTLVGLEAFNNVKINVSSSTVIGNDNYCDSTADSGYVYKQATFVDMEGSILTMPANSIFEIKAKSVMSRAIFDQYDSSRLSKDVMANDDTNPKGLILFKYGGADVAMSISAGVETGAKGPTYTAAVAREGGTCYPSVAPSADDIDHKTNVFWRVFNPVIVPLCFGSQGELIETIPTSYRYRNNYWAYKKCDACTHQPNRTLYKDNIKVTIFGDNSGNNEHY